MLITYAYANTKMKKIIDLVGQTPLLKINHPNAKKVDLYAKLEWYNPSGSVKDRAASFMIKDALKKNQLDGKILIDATSGNTGIAYAMMCANLGIELELALPKNASPERKLILKNFGAKIHFTSPLENTDGSQKFVKKLIQENPNKYYYPDQYNNDNNWLAHYEGTGPEIWHQTQEQVTHYIAGLGTTGSFIGTSRFLQKKKVHCTAIHPNSPLHGLEGWKHLPTAITPGIYDPEVADENIIVSTEKAYSFSKAAARHLGLPLSPSSGANLCSAYELAQSLKSGTVVTLFADNFTKYLQEHFWSDDDYLIENPFK